MAIENDSNGATQSVSVATTDQIALKYDAVTDRISARPFNGTEVLMQRTEYGYWSDVGRTAPPYVYIEPGYAGNSWSARGGFHDEQANGTGGTTIRWGDFVTGVATPSGAVPTTGSATLNADLNGRSEYINWAHSNPNDLTTTPETTSMAITGEGSLSFNFAAGTLGGSFTPIATRYYMCDWDCYSTTYALGTYAFAQTVFGVGQTSFSGKFDVPGGAIGGQFDGRFFGPAAQEVGGNFRAPFQLDGQGAWYDMVGMFISHKN